MKRGAAEKALALHLGLITLLFLIQFFLPEYHYLSLGRVMVLAAYAVGYNILFGYTGLLSLGHAMFFAAGLYGAGLVSYHLLWPAPAAFLAGIAAGLILSLLVGLLALRTTGVAFLIITLMFSQAFYLAALYFSDTTGGDEGIVLPETARSFSALGIHVDLASTAARYNLALALLALSIGITYTLVRAPLGRVLVAIRENESRTRMLGYDSFRYKLAAVVLSGTLSAAAGAAYALLFAYVGATFASIHYSIYPLLWTLMGGAGTVMGPFVGTLLMFYLVDITSAYTYAYLLIVGLALVLLVLFFPQGLVGSLRQRWLPWLP
jgi:branched-chain amino acid transport system permease protein